MIQRHCYAALILFMLIMTAICASLASTATLGNTVLGGHAIVTVFSGADTLYTAENLTGSFRVGDQVRVIVRDYDPVSYDNTVSAVTAPYVVLSGAYTGPDRNDAWLVPANDRLRVNDGDGKTVFSIDADGVLRHYTGVNNLDVDTQLTVFDAAQVFDSRSVSAKRSYTLPTAAAGLFYDFICSDTDSIRVRAGSGDRIKDASGDGEYLVSGSVVSSSRVLATTDSTWVVISKTGTWVQY